MKFDRIVGFGDSWMWGDELLDPEIKKTHPNPHPILLENTPYRENKCFLGQLGEHYNIPTENLGWPGASLQSTIWCYLWWLENSPHVSSSLVLVALTDASRASFYNPRHKSYANDPPWNRFIHGSWVHAGSGVIAQDWVELVKLYTTLSDCDVLNNLNFQQTVWFFNGQSLKHPVLQFCVAPPKCKVDAPSLLWNDTCIKQSLEQTKVGNTIFAPDNHPNEKGHEIIRDMLIPEIDRVIING